MFKSLRKLTHNLLINWFGVRVPGGASEKTRLTCEAGFLILEESSLPRRTSIASDKEGVRLGCRFNVPADSA